MARDAADGVGARALEEVGDEGAGEGERVRTSARAHDTPRVVAQLHGGPGEIDNNNALDVLVDKALPRVYCGALEELDAARGTEDDGAVDELVVQLGSRLGHKCELTDIVAFD